MGSEKQKGKVSFKTKLCLAILAALAPAIIDVYFIYRDFQAFIYEARCATNARNLATEIEVSKVKAMVDKVTSGEPYDYREIAVYKNAYEEKYYSLYNACMANHPKLNEIAMSHAFGQYFPLIQLWNKIFPSMEVRF